jgi:hypothetical protein
MNTETNDYSELRDNCAASLRSSGKRVTLKEDAYVCYVLLFSGVTKPPHTCSPWWLCWVGWKLYILFTVLMAMAITYGQWFQVPYTLELWYIYPMAIASIISSTMYVWLPNLLEGIDKTNMTDCRVTEADIRSATSLSIYFIGISLGFGVISATVRYFKTGSAFISIMDFGMECSTSPVLGAVLLALSLETCLAKKEVQTLIRSAYDQTLTKRDYTDVSELIRKRSKRWTLTLATLVSIAIWNSIGLVVSLEYTVGKVNIFHHGDDDLASEVQVDILIFVALIKESILLFLIIFLIMGINDAADSITSILVDNEWGNLYDVENNEEYGIHNNNNDSGSSDTNNNDNISLRSTNTTATIGTTTVNSERGSKTNDRDNEMNHETLIHQRSNHARQGGGGGVSREDELKELRRAHLILLTTTYAVKPTALTSWYNYLTLTKTKPISFTVCGLRISRSIALGMLLSFFAGLLNAFYKFLLYST